MNDKSGLLVVDKPVGWTSHQVVGRIRRIFHTRKVGHAGTLDPMATGVLLVGINKATRLLGHLALHDKSYLATIRLGQSTNTDDAEGEVIKSSDVTTITETDILSAMSKFTGVIWQRPSSFSAVKINGQRAYVLARKGQEVDLPARQVTVSKFALKNIKYDGFLDLDVHVSCSSGTYVRALARDLGEALQVGGHLTRLRRNRIGNYTIEQAQSLDDINLKLISMADAAKLSFACIEIGEGYVKDLSYGRSLPITLDESPTGLIYDGQLLALYRPDNQCLGFSRPIAVLM